MQLKFVIVSDADLAEAQAVRAGLPAARQAPVILQPMTAQDERFEREPYLDRFAEWVLRVPEDPFWRDCQLQPLPQLHRLCWPHREGL